MTLRNDDHRNDRYRRTRTRIDGGEQLVPA
jgi:hypothetical protein